MEGRKEGDGEGSEGGREVWKDVREERRGRGRGDEGGRERKEREGG